MISRKNKISKIVEKYPNLINTLIIDYNLHCVGCHMAEFETLEQGATIHGMTKKEINKMVKELNKKIKDLKHTKT